MRRLPRPALMVGATCVATSVMVGLSVGLDVSTGPSPNLQIVAAPAAVVVEPVPTPPRPLRARPAERLPVEHPPVAQKVAPEVTLEKRPPPEPKPVPVPSPSPEPEPVPVPVPRPDPTPKPVEPPEPVAPPEAAFTISSFNVLGSSHTRGGAKGKKPGTVRMRQAVRLLRTHDVGIAGVQEMQGDQFRTLQAVAGGAFDVYPGMAAGTRGVENSILWRQADWALESAHTIAIPYFDGRLRPMPYVLLRHVDSDRRIWVANFHNPASNAKRGNNDRHRARAAALETSLATRLWVRSGYPVFVTGDMNDREAYFCRMTSGAPMVAANGGSNDGGCRPPRYPMPVDWIFGTDVVTFTGWVRDQGPLVRRTSDHPMIRAHVLLDDLDGLSATVGD